MVVGKRGKRVTVHLSVLNTTGPARIERSSVVKKDQNVTTVNVRVRRVITASASTGKEGQRGKEAMKTKPPSVQLLPRPSCIVRPALKIPSPPPPPSEKSVRIQRQALCPHHIPVQTTRACILPSRLPIGIISQPHNSAAFEIKLPAHIHLRPTPAWKARLSRTLQTHPTPAITIPSRILACLPHSIAHNSRSPTITISMKVPVQLLQIIDPRSYVSALP